MTIASAPAGSGADSRRAVYRRRKMVNLAALTLSVAAMALGVFWLLWILFDAVRLGVEGLSLATFTESTPPPDVDGGGLANAIAGSLMMTVIAMLVGTPVGILTGIYLSEYGRTGLLAPATRFINDILLSAPSIVIGLLVYSICVVPMRGFSGWAGTLALALIVIPVVVRTTENMLSLVPDALRESAFALGTPKWQVSLMIALKAVKAGVLTGVLLAAARISGETAPLLLTSLSNQFWSLDMSRPIASIPQTIFQFAMSPYDNWKHLAWAGVLLITAAVLALNLAARFLLGGKSGDGK
jgi:phosphate transport system permease protein